MTQRELILNALKAATGPITVREITTHACANGFITLDKRGPKHTVKMRLHEAKKLGEVSQVTPMTWVFVKEIRCPLGPRPGSQSSIVLAVLAASEEPLTSNLIRIRAKKMGVKMLSIEAGSRRIRTILQTLVYSKRVRRVDRGVWALNSQHAA